MLKEYATIRFERHKKCTFSLMPFNKYLTPTKYQKCCINKKICMMYSRQTVPNHCTKLTITCHVVSPFLAYVLWAVSSRRAEHPAYAAVATTVSVTVLQVVFVFRAGRQPVAGFNLPVAARITKLTLKVRAATDNYKIGFCQVSVSSWEAVHLTI